MRTFLILLLFAFVALLLACKKDRQLTDEKRYFGALNVTVSNAFGQRLSGAKIKVVNNEWTRTGETNDYGLARITRVQEGDHTVLVSRKHYLDFSAKATVRRDEETELAVMLEEGEAFFNVSHDSLVVRHLSARYTIEVQSNADWHVTTDADWISPEPADGKGNGKLVLQVGKHEGDSTRRASAQIMMGDSVKTVDIIQTAPLKLMDHTNGQTQLSDSIFLKFNKPVTLHEIRSTSQMCITDDMGFVYTDDRSCVRVKYGCARLGMSFPFTFRVSDDDGNTLADDVTISYFTKRYEIPIATTIGAMAVTDDNKSVWIATAPDEGLDYRLMKLDIATLEVMLDVPLAGAPAHLTINPHNGLVYVTSNYEKPGGIFVFEPKKGRMVKTIVLKPLPQDFEQFPYTVPGSLLFTKSGFGVLNVGSSSTSGGAWRVIDSNKDDTIYYHKDVNPSESAYATLFSPQLINGKRDIVGYLHMVNSVVIDGEKKDYARFFETPVPHTHNPHFFANKINNTVLIMGYWEELLVDMVSDKVFQRSYAGLLPWGFSYRKNEENHIFVIDENHLGLFDYSKGETLFYFRMGREGLMDNTSDGKYFLLAQRGTVYLFDEKMFPGRNRPISPGLVPTTAMVGNSSHLPPLRSGVSSLWR